MLVEEGKGASTGQAFHTQNDTELVGKYQGVVEVRKMHSRKQSSAEEVPAASLDS